MMKTSSILLNPLTLILLVFLTLSGCNRGKNSSAETDLPPGTHAVSVIEVIQTSNYTYLQVFENDQKFWIAITKTEARTGDVIYFTNAMEMKDFKSKELNRVFPSILFVNDPSMTPPAAAMPLSEKQMAQSPGKITAERLTDISVKPVNGGISISELYSKKSDYSEKPRRFFHFH